METFWSSLVILGIIFIIVLSNREKVKDSGILFKISLLSSIVACLGGIGGNFVVEAYIITQIAVIVLILCFIIWTFLIIFRNFKGTINRLVIFFVFLAIVFEVVARSNSLLDLGVDFVINAILYRNISIIGVLFLLFIKSFRLIFGKNKSVTEEIPENC